MVADVPVTRRDVLPHDDAQQSRNGIRIVPDHVAASWPAERLIPAIDDRRRQASWTTRSDGIAARYGMPTADVVAMQLEYPRLSSRELQAA